MGSSSPDPPTEEITIIKRIRDLEVGSLLTAGMLMNEFACNDQVELFRQIWPEGMRIRLNNLLKYAEAELSICWRACETFKGNNWKYFHRHYIFFRPGKTDDEDAAFSYWETISREAYG